MSFLGDGDSAFFSSFFHHRLLGLSGSALDARVFTFLLQGSKTAIDVGIGFAVIALWMRLCDDTPTTIASILYSLLLNSLDSPAMDGELELPLYI